MSTPLIPVTAGTPADNVPTDPEVLGKISYRWPITYTVVALISLLGFVLSLMRRDGAWQQGTTYQSRYGDQWFTVPNFSVPSLLTIIILTILLVAAAAYAFMVTRDRRELPAWLHIVAGVAFVLAFLTWAGAGKTSVIPITSLLAGALALSVPLIFGAMSGVICERSGIINIAIEGQLLFGAFAAAVVASFFAAPYLGLVAAPIAGAAIVAAFVLAFEIPRLVEGGRVEDVVGEWLFLGGVWLLGRWVRQRPRRTEALEEHAAVLEADRDARARSPSR